jgi:hypothetical protein
MPGAMGAPGFGQQAQPGPWGAQRPAGGGFLQGAMATAAGVAGGMVLGNILMNAMSGGGEAQAADAGAAADPAGAEAQPASYEDPGQAYEDPGMDMGGGDEWA